MHAAGQDTTVEMPSVTSVASIKPTDATFTASRKTDIHTESRSLGMSGLSIITNKNVAKGCGRMEILDWGEAGLTRGRVIIDGNHAIL